MSVTAGRNARPSVELTARDLTLCANTRPHPARQPSCRPAHGRFLGPPHWSAKSMRGNGDYALTLPATSSGQARVGGQCWTNEALWISRSSEQPSEASRPAHPPAAKAQAGGKRAPGWQTASTRASPRTRSGRPRGSTSDSSASGACQHRNRRGLSSDSPRSPGDSPPRSRSCRAASSRCREF
jgi:hypothetical protein